jgi:RNA polymerase sigma-70 factor (ECF subfamily)
LLRAYLERRAALVRFCAARLRSPEAAEDLVQELYLKVSAVEAGTEADNPAALLYRMASNLMLDRMRQARRTALRDGRWYQEKGILGGAPDVSQEPPADEAAAARQRLRRMVDAVEVLPPQARRAFELHKLQGLSHAETAKAMGITVSAVEKLISAALKRLLEQLA